MGYIGNFKTHTNIYKVNNQMHSYSYEYGVVIGNGAIEIKDPSAIAELDGVAVPDTLVMFGTKPVTITTDRQDLQKRIIISQATISLTSNVNLTDELFASNNRSIPVTISKLGITHEYDEVVFYGYVDPLQFDQGYAHNWEEVEVTATDPLGALEDLNVGQLTGIDSRTMISPYNLLLAILEKLDVTEPSHSNIDSTVWSAFTSTRINMTNFFGDSEDDWMSLYDTLEEILKYFNMYIAMKGEDVILISTINHIPTPYIIDSFSNYATDESTSISVDDVYSQVALTCEIEPVKDALIELANDDYLHSPYKHQELYMTEIVSPGEGERAFNAFTQMVQLQAMRQHINEDTTLTQAQIAAYKIGMDNIKRELTYENAYTVDNFCYLLVNDAWDFGSGGYDKQDFITDHDHHDQREALIWLAQPENRFKPAFIGFGRGDKIQKSISDNSPKASVKLDNWLVIPTMGQLNNTYEYANGTLKQQLQNLQPIRYKNEKAQILSPADSEVTNYLIITGSILLNPLQQKTRRSWMTDLQKIKGTWETGSELNEIRGLFSPVPTSLARELWHHTVPNPDNGDGAYYTQAWEYATIPYHGNNDAQVLHPMGVYGYLDNKENEQLKYEYNANGDSQDIISKIPILACELKVVNNDPLIPDKYCVERLDRGEKGVGVFQWMTEAECQREGIQNHKYFTIGIDPKIGDSIIGQTFKVQNNLDYTKGLNTSGTGIPIRHDDDLAGILEFKILGPYNIIYDQTKKSTHTKWIFWECTHINTTPITLLENIQSIMIKDLKIEATSDNGLRSKYATTADNDLVYASDMQRRYIDKLEDDVKVCSCLTLQECEQNGIKYEISNSYILNSDNTKFYGFVKNGQTTKPEKCLVDYYFKEYCQQEPARIIETQFMTELFNNGPLGNNLTFDMLNTAVKGIYPRTQGNNDWDMESPFMIMSYETDLKMQRIDMKLREDLCYEVDPETHARIAMNEQI